MSEKERAWKGRKEKRCKEEDEREGKSETEDEYCQLQPLIQRMSAFYPAQETNRLQWCGSPRSEAWGLIPNGLKAEEGQVVKSLVAEEGLVVESGS